MIAGEGPQSVCDPDNPGPFWDMLLEFLYNLLISAGVTLTFLPLPFLIGSRKEKLCLFLSHEGFNPEDGYPGDVRRQPWLHIEGGDHEITSQTSFPFAAMTTVHDASLTFPFHVLFFMDPLQEAAHWCDCPRRQADEQEISVLTLAFGAVPSPLLREDSE